ncbi:MAG: hypothetical protein IJ814_03370 [Paludibacteraceae bacterium]|nr:hypothetical protein [Paludibacteraceae bacterium]
MKKLSSYIILLVAVLISGTAKADIKHYIGAQINGGEWSLWDNAGPTGNDVSYGAAGALGFNYEMQVGPTYGQTRFLLNVGLSAQAGMTVFISKRNFTCTLPGQKDSQNDDFTYVYELSNRRDRYNKLVAQVPILVGVQHKRFYMLAGVKLGYNALGTYKTQGQLTTYGRYDQFIDPITKFPVTQFYDEPQLVSKDGKSTINPISVDATIEMGGRIGFLTNDKGYDVPKRIIEYRMAVFADYGVFGYAKWYSNDAAFMVPKGTTYSETTDMRDFVAIHDVLSSRDYIPSNVKHNVKEGDFIGHNIMIGLKFTVLFLMPDKGKCVLCNDNYNGSSRRSSGGRRGVKYEE